jgi:hypothetical protein
MLDFQIPICNPQPNRTRAENIAEAPSINQATRISENSPAESRSEKTKKKKDQKLKNQESRHLTKEV